MSDKEACLVDCVAYHKSIGCSYKLLCPFLHRELPADVCRANLGGQRCRNYNCALNHPTPEALLPAPRSEVERLAALSKEVIQVWAGRSNVKYEVREKKGPRMRENTRESWDDWARERKWSWGRRREEEERWNQGRGEISGQGRGDVSGQGKGETVVARECLQPLDSWDNWARERKLSWGKKKEEKVEETGSKWKRSEVAASGPAHFEMVVTQAQAQAEESLPDIQVVNIPAAVPALEVKKICQNIGELTKFRYYSMLGDLGSRGFKQVIVNYKAAEHHKWAREQLGKEVRKLAAGTTWANVASEFSIKAVVMKVECTARSGTSDAKVLDLTKGVGHRQFRSEAVNEKQENYSQLTSSELEKRDQQVAGVDRELAPQILKISKEEQEDKKLLEEVDREAIDNNLIRMVNEW